MQTKNLLISKLNPYATWPQRMTKFSCGHDLSLIDELYLKPFETVCVSIGIGVEIPENVCGLVIGRSSLAKNHRILCHTGLIDSDFRGEISVILFSLNSETVHFPAKTRVAQIVFMNLFHDENIIHSDSISSCPLSQRTGGLGSTN